MALHQQQGLSLSECPVEAPASSPRRGKWLAWSTGREAQHQGPWPMTGFLPCRLTVLVRKGLSFRLCQQTLPKERMCRQDVRATLASQKGRHRWQLCFQGFRFEVNFLSTLEVLPRVSSPSRAQCQGRVHKARAHPGQPRLSGRHCWPAGPHLPCTGAVLAQGSSLAAHPHPPAFSTHQPYPSPQASPTGPHHPLQTAVVLTKSRKA